jgi:hypothetical protein
LEVPSSQAEYWLTIKCGGRTVIMCVKFML